MRRHEFLLVLGREDARKERKRALRGELYDIEWESLCADSAVFVCLAHHGSTSSPDTQEIWSHTQPVDPSFAKLVYLEATQALLRDRLQPTWGRVQQKEELEYEPIVKLVAVLRRLRSQMTKQSENVLEEFEGFVEKFDNDVAHVTLKTKSGEIFYGEYPAIELKAQGIRERRRFKCWTVEVGPSVEFVMEPIPDRELSEERERQIDEWLQKSLGDDDAPQNDY
jgi:hypothetical protein